MLAVSWTSEMAEQTALSNANSENDVRVEQAAIDVDENTISSFLDIGSVSVCSDLEDLCDSDIDAWADQSGGTIDMTILND